MLLLLLNAILTKGGNVGQSVRTKFARAEFTPAPMRNAGKTARRPMTEDKTVRVERIDFFLVGIL